MIRLTHATGAVALLAAASLIACGDDDPMGPAGPIDVTLNFAAAVNGADFACGTSYADVGTSATEITPVDFRFYVHGVELINADGSAEEVELDENTWQRDGVVLLDFENGSGPCVNGTAATNTAITGSVPAGDYTGIRFVLGVSEDLNHADQTTARRPPGPYGPLLVLERRVQVPPYRPHLRGPARGLVRASREHRLSAGRGPDGSGHVLRQPPPSHHRVHRLRLVGR